MPVEALGGLSFLRPGARPWCVVRQDRRAWLEDHGLTSARDFLAVPGVVVSGHVGRNVSRVRIGPTTAYLKREHRVRLRDRFRSWRDGFGWASISAREAAVLRRLEEHGLPAPTCLACGEAAGEAFLLLEAAGETVELCAMPSVSPGLAERMGRIVARLHAAGIDQPDLFAKHFLVRPHSGEVTILDWQRATLGRRVPWRRRIRGLAALRATGPAALIAVWEELLGAYLEEARSPGDAAPATERLRAAIVRAASALAKRAGIRSQQIMPTTGAPQELIRIDGETVCAVPAVAGELGSADAIEALYRPGRDGRLLAFADGRVGVLRVRRYRQPFGRLWAALRGRAWRSRELKIARLLFHLERHGIPAPKLLAYGQRAPRLAPAGSFVLSEPLPARPPRPEDRDAMCQLLERLHATGCRLRGLGPAGEPFGIAANAAVVTDASLLCLDRRLSQRRARRDLARLDAFFKGGQ
jgi:Lipopolysaccharide kinase (Kdo/WaaP) family